MYGLTRTTNVRVRGAVEVLNTGAYSVSEVVALAGAAAMRYPRLLIEYWPVEPGHPALGVPTLCSVAPPCGPVHSAPFQHHWLVVLSVPLATMRRVPPPAARVMLVAKSP